jgi:hypothetical protein
MDLLKIVNLGLRFLLELCTLAALAYWGFHTGQGWLLKTALGIGAPLLAAVVWGAFVAPKAVVSVSAPARLALELAVFASAVAGLAAARQTSLAWTLGVAYAINRILIAIWGQ